MMMTWKMRRMKIQAGFSPPLMAKWPPRCTHSCTQRTTMTSCLQEKNMEQLGPGSFDPGRSTHAMPSTVAKKTVANAQFLISCDKRGWRWHCWMQLPRPDCQSVLPSESGSSGPLIRSCRSTRSRVCARQLIALEVPSLWRTPKLRNQA